MSNVLIVRLSLKQRVIMLLTGILLIITSFVFGYYLSESEFLTKLGNVHSLKKSCSQLKDQYDQVLEEKYRFENNLLVEKKTNMLLKEKLNDFTSKITQYKTELSFYKGIVDDSANTLGIYFNKISIKAADAKEQELFKKQKEYTSFNVYKLSITMARKIKSKTYRRGRIEIDLLDANADSITDWKIFDEKGKTLRQLKTRFQYINTYDYFLLINKEQAIDKIQFSFHDSIKGKLDIGKEINWNKSKEMTYVGQ